MAAARFSWWARCAAVGCTLVLCAGRTHDATSESDKVIEFVKSRSHTAVAGPLADAATAHRATIRRFLEVDQIAASESWLDEVVGFTSKQAKDLVEAKLRAAIARGKLVVGIMGISTTAGHDCYYNQSFPKVFERHLAAPLAAAGVEVEVRNQAIGGFGVLPSTHLCIETLVGSDVDILAWDFQMMSPRGDCKVEHFARAALNLPSKPVVLFWQGGVYLAKVGNLEKSLVAPPRNNAKQSCKGQWIVPAYASAGVHYGNLVSLLQRMRYLGHSALLANGTEPLFADPLKGTRPDPDFGEPAFVAPGRRRLARHHPGPRMHRLWGLAWAHACLGLVAEAVRGPPPAVEPKPVAPKVVGCAPELCDGVRPKCATATLPRAPAVDKQGQPAGYPLLEDMLRPGHDWTVVDPDNWQRAMDMHGYIDQKRGIRSHSSSPVTVSFVTETPNLPLAVCETPCPWGRCKQGRVVFGENSEFALDGAPLDPGKFVVQSKHTPAKFSALVDSTCMVVAQSVPSGPHELTITPKLPSPDAWILVSHLIYF